MRCVLTSNEVHFVSLPNNFTVPFFKTFETPIFNVKQNSLTGPVITGSFQKRAPGPFSFFVLQVSRRRIGPFHDPVTWYGIYYAGTHITQ